MIKTSRKAKTLPSVIQRFANGEQCIQTAREYRPGHVHLQNYWYWPDGSKCLHYHVSLLVKAGKVEMFFDESRNRIARKIEGATDARDPD